jgi:hypothetical protein
MKRMVIAKIVTDIYVKFGDSYRFEIWRLVQV